MKHKIEHSIVSCNTMTVMWISKISGSFLMYLILYILYLIFASVFTVYIANICYLNIQYVFVLLV